MRNLYDIGPARRKIRMEFEVAALEALDSLPRLFGIRPTDLGLAVRTGGEGYRADPMRWGFAREFNPSVNNARADKLAGPMWQKAFQERRCLIPMGTFYEWTGPKGHKQAHAIRPRDEEEWLWCAGIWEAKGEAGLCYSMITMTAPPWMVPAHQRIPAIFQSLEDAERYLRAEDAAALLQAPEEPLLIDRCESSLRQRVPGPPVQLK